MLHPILSKTARIIVVESSEIRRTMLSAGLRELGFKNVTNARSLDVAIETLEAADEVIDWLITPLCGSQPVNALGVLAMFTKEPRFRDCRMTLLSEPNEAFCLEAAFELGLYTWHDRAKDIGSQLLRFVDLMQVIERYDGNDCLVAAHYLRQFLVSRELYPDYLRLETALASRFPKVPRLVLTTAEALHLSGHPQAALQALARAKDLPPALGEEAEVLAHRITQAAGFDPADEVKFAALNGLRRCVIIDPDDAALNALEASLRGLGVPEIIRFADGQEAWAYLRKSPDPDLIILEWRIPKVLGPTLIQRLQAKSRSIAPIVVYSALVKSSSDRMLLRELGVAEVMEKPMTKKQLLTMLSGIVKEHRRPKSLNSAARSIRLALMARDIPLAERTFAEMKASHQDVPLGLKLTLEAEIAFQHGHYEESSSQAIKALHVVGEDIMILNLLGKIYMRLRQFEQAQTFFNRANAIAPGNIERLCQIAEVQVERGQTHEAKATLDRALALDDNNDRVQEVDAIVSLARGDVAAARSAMLDLDSISGIVSFMNNRAVALAMVKHLKDSVELYERTLASMPASMSETKAIVCYNLALSLIKQGNISAADACLSVAPKAKAGTIHGKIASLTAKVKSALKSKTPLKLNVSRERLTEADDTELTTDVAQALPTAIGIEPGTMRCHLVFQGSRRPGPEVWALLADIPTFVPRATFQKGK